MFANYMHIAFHIFTKNKLFSLLNIFSLAIGMACCLIIFLFIQYELSYDKQYQEHENIYRVERTFFDSNGGDVSLATTAPLVGPLFKQEFSEVQDMTRLRLEQVSISKNDIVIFENHVGWVDSNFFDFFGLEFVIGDRQSAKLSPTSVILSESAAVRYFGVINPLGDSILLNGELELQVVGVFRDFPLNTHMKVDVVMSIDLVNPLMGQGQMESWGANSYYTYIKMQENYDIQKLENKTSDFLTKHFNPNASEATSLPIISITDIHLYSHNQNEIQQNGSISTVHTFGAIAIFALLVACINFVNLTTARSSRRAKEIGIRKAIGAKFSQLVFQFLFESILMSALAMLFALVIVDMSLPFFANFLQRDLDLTQIYNLNGFITILVFVFLVGTIAGSYPALGLAKLDPVKALKGGILGSGSSGLTRKALVIFQFSISICLIVASIVVYQQVQYAKNVDIGYDRFNKIVLKLPSGLPFEESYVPFKSKLQRHSDINPIAVSSNFPTNQLLDGSAYFRDNASISPENVINLRDVRIDYDFLEIYQVKLIAGRFFKEEFNDRQVVYPDKKNAYGRANIVVNESALKIMGFDNPQDAIGQELIQPLNDELTAFIRYPIVGVVADFYFSSLHTKFQPVVFTPLTEDVDRFVTLQINRDNATSVLPFIETTWKEMFPAHSFAPLFLEQKYRHLYHNEEQQAILLALFALLTVLVGIMGLYGLASHSTERRSKELCIRKVHGARSGQIVMLISSEFIKLVLIATAIAWPFAYWFMSDWLTQFAYAVNLGIGPFVVATLIALFISSITTMFQALRLANSRPVKYLRYE